MTGKLDIGRGTDYGFYPRLAKHHAESLAHHGGTPHPGHEGAVLVDGTVVPETGTNGVLWKMTFKTGGMDQATGAVDGNASRADVLHGLVKETDQLVSNGLLGPVNTDGTNIYMKPGVLGAITDAVIVDASGTNPSPPPDEDGTWGPYTSAYGADWWNKREDGDWFVCWDIDSDPDPDVCKQAEQVLMNEDLSLAYRNDISDSLVLDGWPG